MNKIIGLLLTVCFSWSALANTVVRMETTMGNIDIELNDEKAPITAENFLKYVDSGFFEQTIIHRVVKNFVIQGGGLTQDMVEKPTLPPIKNEAKNGLSNLRGTIGMARTNEIDSASSQWFINTKDNTRLDYRDEDHYGYAVFGKVISGMDIVDMIEAVVVHDIGEYGDVPVTPIVVTSVKRVQ
ncbi:MAG: peptidylprolyl isomerase [Pseudobdellovibrionaceae bacterium]